MAPWHRIGAGRLRCLSHWCWRWYSPLSAAAAVESPGERRVLRALENPLFSRPARPSPSLSRNPVRFFAAPVQAKPKPHAVEQGGPRLNGAITAPHVRLVTDEGHYIVSRWEALDRAMKLNLDLVEVQRTADPPVCKIMDFHKEKFKQEEKEKERAKSKSALTLRSGESKDVRFKAKTEAKDLKIKAEAVMRLMERGYRVKCTAMPTGKEEEDLGGLLSRLLALIGDVSIVESGPHLDTKQAYVIVRHVKFATKKSGKKVGKVMDDVIKGLQTIPDMPATISDKSEDEMPLQSEEEGDPIECVSESTGDVSSDQVEENIPKETGWSVFNASDDFGDIFNFDHKIDNINSAVSESMGTTISHPPKDITGNKPSHQRPPATSASKPELGSLKAILESKEEPPKDFVSRSKPFVVESNRYSKPGGHMERFQPQPTRNERDRRGQLDQGNSSTPSSPPKHGIFYNRGTGTSRDQGNVVDVNTGKPSTSTPSYGVSAGHQRKVGDATLNKPDNVSPTPTYGIFSASKTYVSGSKTRPGDARMTGEESRLISPKNLQGPPKSEIGTHRHDFDSREGRRGVFSRDTSTLNHRRASGN